MNNDINEKIVHAAPVPPFVRFVASAVPMVFDNSLSYYECLCALWKWMQDNLVDVINNNATVTEHYIDLDLETRALFNQLKTYVDTYFDNLDVQDEINNKLDAMAEAGTLQEIITTYIQSNVAWTFDTVADMKQATNLVDGSYAQTLGFHSVNDGGGALYKITNSGTANEMNIIAVGSLFAYLVTPKIATPEMFGAKGDGSSDDTINFATAIADLKTVGGKLKLQPKTYMVRQLSVDDGTYIEGCGVTSVIKGHGNATADQNRLIIGFAKNNWTLSNFKVDVNSTARTNITESDIAVNINGGKNIEIDRLTIIGGTPTNSYCIRVGQHNGTRPSNINIHDCDITLSQGGFNGIAVTCGLNVTVHNNIIHSNYSNCGSAIDVEANTASDESLDFYRLNYINITNNTCMGAGISLMGKGNSFSNSCNIVNNHIQYTVSNTSEAAEALVVDGIKNVIITDNIISYNNPNSSTSGTSYNAIRLNGDNITFSNNIVSVERDCYSFIRSISSGNNIIVMNNTFNGNSHSFNRTFNHINLENATYSNNKVVNFSADYVFYFANTAESAIGKIIIENNIVENTKGRGLYVRKHILVKVQNNYIACYRNLIDGSTNVIVTNNIFNRLSSSYEVFENPVKSENSNFKYSDNTVIGASGSIWNNKQGIYTLTSIPVSGYWERGDIVIASLPSGSAPMGWVCVESGTPGTWKALANIGA